MFNLVYELIENIHGSCLLNKRFQSFDVEWGCGCIIHMNFTYIYGIHCTVIVLRLCEFVAPILRV